MFKRVVVVCAFCWVHGGQNFSKWLKHVFFNTGQGGNTLFSLPPLPHAPQRRDLTIALAVVSGFNLLLSIVFTAISKGYMDTLVLMYIGNFVVGGAG